jgi:hypothetical protein
VTSFDQPDKIKPIVASLFQLATAADAAVHAVQDRWLPPGVRCTRLPSRTN